MRCPGNYYVIFIPFIPEKQSRSRVKIAVLGISLYDCPKFLTQLYIHVNNVFKKHVHALQITRGLTKISASKF